MKISSSQVKNGLTRVLPARGYQGEVYLLHHHLAEGLGDELGWGEGVEGAWLTALFGLLAGRRKGLGDDDVIHSIAIGGGATQTDRVPVIDERGLLGRKQEGHDRGVPDRVLA